MPVAVNVDRDESHLVTMEEAVFLKSIARPTVARPRDAAGTSSAGETREHDRLWWIMLALAGLALLADAWLANRLVTRSGAAAANGASA